MLPSIQALRALAVYLVVLVHLPALIVMAGGPADPFFFGNAGVDLFFVISGLMMVFSTARPETSAWDFFGRRVTRVVPLYWFITMVVFTIALLAPSLFQSTRADPVQLIKSLLFVPFRRDNGLIEPIVFVGWTLNYEMFFYLIFTAALFFRSRRTGLALIFATLMGLVLFRAVGKPNLIEVRFYTHPVLLEFAMGMTLGLVLPNLPKHISTRWPFILLGCLAFSAFVWGPLAWPSLDRVVVFGLPAFLVTLSALALDRSGVTIRPLLTLLGDASYSIFLTHFFVTQTIVKVAEKLQWGGIGVMTGLFILALVGTALVGVLTHFFIEKPLINAARRLFGLSIRTSALTASGKHPVLRE